MYKSTLRRAYVWQFAVRMFHWINALCIVVLALTGYLIGRPIAFSSASEASFSYWFGTVRFIHFTAAYILIFNFLFRIYWGFVGNEYANWRNFIPLRRSQWVEIGKVLKVDILLGKMEEPLPSTGHNALAGVVYFLSFLVFLAQVITGLALYSAMSDWPLANMFAWVVPLFGGDFGVRQWHHMLMWFFPIFILVHVYLVAYHDYVEGRGVMSSMVGGWKFIDRPSQDARSRR
ncbi:MAG: Ni/Fe-hydrogenase, b-type cytochrome subunit [Candidatus Krumholzibacteria bacterium]|nr:Ni/Fe-hydrogenase, b-type cytochrome subunit [Candidatus Krumholzibacteria bacterium]